MEYTLEDYVIRELVDKKNEIRKLEDQIAELEKHNKFLIEAGKGLLMILQQLKKYVNKKSSSDGVDYFSMDYIFERHDKEAYEAMDALYHALEEDDEEFTEVMNKALEKEAARDAQDVNLDKYEITI